MSTSSASRIPARKVRLGPADVAVTRSSDGAIYVRSTHALGPYPAKMTERLDYWAERAPDRTFIAQRAPDGSWREARYAQFRSQARNVAQALIDRGLSAERPVAVLSGNDIEHALVGFGAMYAGIPYSPISPAYSLISSDFRKLRHIFDLLTPGLVFASGPEYRRAIEAVVPAGTEVASGLDAFSELASASATDAVDEAHARVGPDTIAKILFTSGSTGTPKGVINTHRMWCSNQEMIRTCLPFLMDEPPVLCEWMPWHHTFGGNHDLGLILFNGGTLYIDDGNPTPAGVEKTVRNLREVGTTFYLGVPKGFEALLPYLRGDGELRERFFSRLKLLWYAGAGLSQHVADELEELAIQACGERILMLTGLGSTETAPFALAPRREVPRVGMVGVPSPGVELKLVPAMDKLEARVRGPSITPGYWRQDDLTRAAFDEEGFYKLGDALRFVDESRPSEGFLFDGRIAEDFKLSTGTWVSVGPLRAGFLSHFAPYVQDVVIAGHDRGDVRALVFPALDKCRELSPRLPKSAPESEVLASEPVRAKFQYLLEELAKSSTGSSNRIVRALLMEEAPSIDAHEVTDKGSLNQGAVLRNRAALVEELYSSKASSRATAIETESV